jgi:hypothetical protein
MLWNLHSNPAGKSTKIAAFGNAQISNAIPIKINAVPARLNLILDTQVKKIASPAA